MQARSITYFQMHFPINGIDRLNQKFLYLLEAHICLCWGFTAQSTQWGHVERGQFT